MVQLEIGLAMAVEMGRAELLLISGGRLGGLLDGGQLAIGRAVEQAEDRGQKQGRNQGLCSDPISDLSRDPRDMEPGNRMHSCPPSIGE